MRISFHFHIKYIRNSLGNRKLLYKGFVYVKKKEETSYWRCERRKMLWQTLDSVRRTMGRTIRVFACIGPSRVAFELAVKYAMFIINFYIFHYVIFF